MRFVQFKNYYTYGESLQLTNVCVCAMDEQKHDGHELP